MSALGGTQLGAISARRRRTDRAMRALLWLATGIALIPLILVVYYLLHRGLGEWNSSFFTTDPNGNFFGNHGGIRSAIVGSLEMMAIATAAAIPLGIAVAVWLVEYGKESLFANTVRYFVDVMTGVPSIVFGLFIYIVLVISHFGGSGYAAWKGSLAVFLLMLPIVIRSSEVVLQLVPNSLREAALALGSPRWRVITRVVLPTSLSGLATGSLLAVARGMGETAPLLFTVSYTMTLSGSPNGLMNSLPVQIFTDIKNPEQAIQNRAWAAALVLVTIVLILNMIARAVARRSSVK